MSSYAETTRDTTFKNHPRYKNLMMEVEFENGILTSWLIVSDVRGSTHGDVKEWGGAYKEPTEEDIDEGADETVDTSRGDRLFDRIEAKLQAQDAAFARTKRAREIATKRRRLQARKAGLMSAAKRHERRAGVLAQAAEAVDGAIDSLFGISKKKRRRRRG